jgi:hypothetical protein
MREGGSLPGLMEADDLGTYVVKFHGAGQGRKTLVAEVVAAAVARALGLAVPDLVTVEVDPALAPGEPDQEVQDLLRASAGTNLGVDYLPGALDLDRPGDVVDAEWAGRALWFDAYLGNVDRSWRNPNMLLWHGRPYLIDHGATLTFHHSWPDATTWPGRVYDATGHALAGLHPDAHRADAALGHLVDEALLEAAVREVPEQWLAGEPGFGSADAVRAAYLGLLLQRLEERDRWLTPLGALVAR